MFELRNIASYAIVLCALSACASATGCANTPRRAAPVGATTTTSTDAPAYAPGEVALSRARQEGACPRDLSQDVDFAPRTAELLAGEGPGLDAWAKCLSYPGLEHVTIVLVGGDEREGPVGLFLQRAQRVRDALAARGVDAHRVVIGATNAGREGPGSRTSTGSVRLEMTTLSTIRAYPPQTKVHYRAH